MCRNVLCSLHKKEIEQFYIDTDIGTNRSTYVSVCLIDAIFDDYNLIPDQEIFLDNVE